MMTALLCARNIIAGESLYDLWFVNQDAEYHESGSSGHEEGASGLRAVPTRIKVGPELANNKAPVVASPLI
jgi:hypothetical protein